MVWKTEKWLDELFPGGEKLFSAYSGFTEREFVIIAAATLDAALAEILSKRLRDYPSEIESFLGVNGDGRAPAASFGARIQLGLLTGILSIESANVLRGVKNLRNMFAHRVNANFSEDPVLSQTKKLLGSWRVFHEAQKADTSALDDIGKVLAEEPAAGHGMVMAILMIFNSYFHQMEKYIDRIGPVRSSKA